MVVFFLPQIRFQYYQIFGHDFQTPFSLTFKFLAYIFLEVYLIQKGQPNYLCFNTNSYKHSLQIHTFIHWFKSFQSSHISPAFPITLFMLHNCYIHANILLKSSLKSNILCYCALLAGCIPLVTCVYSYTQEINKKRKICFSILT